MDFMVDGLKTHVATGGRDEVAGEPVVILIHGAGLDRTIWQLQSRSIAFRDRRVLSVDMPGHGRSEGKSLQSISDMADWIGRFMDAAGVESAMLIGHSMGALVALEAAARLPERIEQLVLMGAAEKMPVHPDLLKAAQDNKPLAPELIVYWGLGEKAKIGGHPEPGLWVHSAIEVLLKLAPENVLASDLNACNDYKNGSESATMVNCPTLLVLGHDDLMTPAKAGKALADHIADSRTVVIEKCGHMMMIEHPNQVFNAFNEFVF